MTVTVAIGEFARMSHLSVKTLRYYHDIGLLTPAEVDAFTGYRRYAVTQAGDALLIRRLRELDMPLPGVRAVLAAPTAGARNAAIAHHLAQMEAELARTQMVVASLRELLTPGEPIVVEYRSAPEFTALTTEDIAAHDEIGAWCSAAFAGLYAQADRSGLTVTGPAGATYSAEFFTGGEGAVTAFIPVTAGPGTSAIDAQQFAVAIHAGPYSDIDRTYAALGTHVAQHNSAGAAPVREVYLLGPDATADPARYQTEVCWPVTH